ncbi:WD repeat-containing protein 81 isoform X1 [Astyanax mexicanus]|uniref:WD repeat-containing protein 81 n=1 Tax=Astyanax mexicanus TaxID=7994 RepID=A0A8B9LUX2_ASTMX|nr:WD repeat-containing protein 81 isoform X1 [Astyanax mexicanus]
MEWLASAIERDLGVDQRQIGPGPRPDELVAFVPTRWVMGLREGRITRCARCDCASDGDIRTLLQRSQAKFPPGWTRVCIQGIRKSKLGYKLAKEQGLQWEGLSQDSFMRQMQKVSQCNIRNLWQEAYMKHVQPYAGPTEQTQVLAIDAVRQALQKLFGCSFLSTDRVSPSLSPAREKERECPISSSSTVPKQHTDTLCPNVLQAECLLESGEVLYIVCPYTQYSLHDIVTFSPAKLANSNAKVLFILYQVLIAIRECHASGLSCGELSLQDVAVDEQLCTRLKISLAHYEELGEDRATLEDATVRKVPRNAKERGTVSVKSDVNVQHCQDCLHELKALVLDWVHGRVSNFTYLMELNRLAGRREGDPNYHPVLPWVVDFTVPYGRFRDLRRSKFRLNKGDKQLDFTYEMTKEALAAAVANGGGGSGFSSDLVGSVGPGCSGQSDHLHVPHHISDVLSDITYYVYKARRTPKSVLCSHVRSQWEPNEYPASMERIQGWTPDECIPEFYTDPSIFRSIHPDMPDLDVPPWCNSYEEFIAAHRRLLESREVSQQLHHWIDLTFGYKLSGKDAVKAKNVCLHLVDNHTHLTSYGVVQLFDQPHPPRLAPYQYSPAEPPHLGPVSVSAWQIPLLDTGMDGVDGMVPEATGCESSGWTMVDRDEDLEQGTEALDSLSAVASATTTIPVPAGSSAGCKTTVESTSLAVSPAHGSFPAETSNSGTNALGSSIRGTMLQRGPSVMKKPEGHAASNGDDFKVALPEGFKPLQPLEELEKLNNFLGRGLHSQVLETIDVDWNIGSKVPLSFTDLFHRDMQALGVFIAEIFSSSKLRGVKPGTTLSARYQAVMKLCSASLRDIPLPLHHALESLLYIRKHASETYSLNLPSTGSSPVLFKYDPISEGLPPPNPWQLLSPVLSPIPYPEYFPVLHKFIFSYHSKMESINSIQGRDIVFNLWQQLQTLLQEEITAEGLEILLPFVLALMTEESTAVYAAWYLFEPVSRVLGPRNASKYLIKPLIGVYENPCCLRGRFYLYTDCFVLQLIVRIGLQAFLSSLLPHVLQVITGFESCNTGAGSEWQGLKGLRGAVGGLGEEEEDYDCEDGRPPSSASAGKVGAGSGGGGGGVGGVGDAGLIDYSSGISLSDQVFLTEGEDFQNGFYVNNGSSPAAGVSAKQQNQNSANKDQDQESLSVGKLSDKSSASEVSIGDGDSTKDRASLKSADSSQDLKQASDGEDGGELEDEDETVEDKEGTVQKVPSLELTLSGCTEESDVTVGTQESDFMNGMEQGEADKNIVVEDDDHDPSENSEEKEHKILLDTVCKTVRWLVAKLGPTVTSRYVARNLLRLLTSCYIGPEKHQFVQSANEESSLDSVGSVYEKKPVVGDRTAKPVLDCLIYIAHLYGEPVLTYQYLPYIGYLVSPPSSCRLNTRKEAGLLGAVVLTQKIIVFLSDSTLMDMLMKINQDVLLPLLDLLTSPKMGFPSGVQTRSALCLKTLSLMALICLRIGREMVQQHMADTLCQFFQVFTLLHSLQNQMDNAPRREVGEYTYVDVFTPEGSEVTCELGVLEELQAVFNSEMAYASYIPFYCLIGDAAIRKLVPNHELVWGLAQSYHDRASPGSPEFSLASGQRAEMAASSMGHSPSLSHHIGRSPFPAPSCTSTPLGGDALPESGTFGSHLVGNRIQVKRDTEPGGSPNLASMDTWGRPHVTYAPPATTTTVGPISSLSSSSWVLGHTPEDSALKQELPRSSRSLQGNWLAYWQYEIGLNQQDSHFHFHQIRLQSFLGHTGSVKCLASLAGEDYFLSGSKDKTVKLWPLYNHGDGTREVEPRLTYAEHRKSVFSVVQLEALQEVVSCDGTVHLWDQFTGKQIRSYEALDGKNPITAVTTMPAPHCSVVFASTDSVLRFIDPRKPGLQHEFRLAYNNMSAGLIRCLAVSPGGRTVAAGFSSGFVVLLDARTGLVLRGWPAHEGDILQMKATDGNLLVSSSTDHTLTVWKDLEHKPLHQYRTPSDPTHAFDLYGAEIVAGTVSNKIGVYSMLDISASPASSTKLSSENFRGTLTSLAVLPTKRLLLLGSENGAIRLLA